MSENLSPATPESASPVEAVEDTKNKKKKKAIGAFVVEADPNPKSESFWRRNKGKQEGDKPAETPEKTDGKPAETAESNPDSVEELDELEVSEATKQLAAARRQELDVQPADPTATQAELAAAAAYLAAVEASGNLEAEAELEVLASEVASEDAAKTGEIESPEDVEAELPTSPAEIIIDTETLSEGEIVLDEPATPPVPPAPPTTPPPPGSTPPPPISGSGGGGGLPPTTPIGPGFNTAPTPPAVFIEQTVPLANALAAERKAQTDGLVVGAVVGYLLGRRRGRIKTEKRLAPVQKKLETQVRKLQTQLLEKEQTVRQTYREQQIAPIVTRAAEVKKSPPQLSTAPEHIGHVLIAASADKEKVIKKIAPKLELAVAKTRVESMDRDQLLAVSQNVIVEGTSLRKIYETQLVSEKGLRRLIVEHLRGGNVTKLLKRELIERQIDFERDPILRDKSHVDQPAKAGKAALAVMLAKAGVAESSERVDVGPAEKKMTAKPAAKKKTTTQNIADISLASLIGLLLFLILLLLLRG